MNHDWQGELNSLLVQLENILPVASKHEARFLIEDSFLAKGIDPAMVWVTGGFSVPIEKSLFKHIEHKSLEWARRRVAENIPMQYLTGRQAFGDRRYHVAPGVLIPRQESELLIEEVRTTQRTLSTGRRFGLGLEIGLGSGAISIELLCRNFVDRMVASEVSAEAIAIAETNREEFLGPYNTGRLEIFRAATGLDIFEPFVTDDLARVELFVSNPPYLAAEDDITSDVRQFEPAAALFPIDGNPNYFYEAFAREILAGRLPELKLAVFEISHDRAAVILELFKGLKSFDAKLVPDLTGRPRFISLTGKNTA